MRKEKTGPRRRAATDTAGALFEDIIRRAKQAGDLDRAAPILEYCYPCISGVKAGQETGRSLNDFDFVPSLILGVGNSIYLDCFLREKFNGYGYRSFRIGTIKTSGADMDTCKIVGELCGALMHHARQSMAEQSARPHEPHPARIGGRTRASAHH